MIWTHELTRQLLASTSSPGSAVTFGNTPPTFPNQGYERNVLGSRNTNSVQRKFHRGQSLIHT